MFKHDVKALDHLFITLRILLSVYIEVYGKKMGHVEHQQTDQSSLILIAGHYIQICFTLIK